MKRHDLIKDTTSSKSAFSRGRPFNFMVSVYDSVYTVCKTSRPEPLKFVPYLFKVNSGDYCKSLVALKDHLSLTRTDEILRFVPG